MDCRQIRREKQKKREDKEGIMVCAVGRGENHVARNSTSYCFSIKKS